LAAARPKREAKEVATRTGAAFFTIANRRLRSTRKVKSSDHSPLAAACTCSITARGS